VAGGSARWRLEIVGADGERRAVPLSKEVVIGRDRDVGLRLDDQSISRKHARLYFDDQGSLWIEDLGSGNGVYLDGRRIREASAVASKAKLKLGVFTLTPEDVKGPDLALAKSKAKDELAAPDKAKGPPKPAAPPAPLGCALRGKAGAFLNKDFVLLKPVVKVGRVADGNDIAIQDDSVSREHARFTRAGRGYVLRDLSSANGTSVNGERILERPVASGDLVRFGTVEFEYFGPPPIIHQPLDPKRKRQLILGSVGVAGVLMLLFVLKLAAHEDQLDKPPPTTATQDEIAEAERHVGLAQDERREESWERSLKEYQEAIRLDPINLDARKGLKEVEREIQMKQTFDRAKQRVDVGQDEEGVDLYLKIETSSTYYPRAQAEVERLAALLVRRYLEICHTATHAEDQQGIVDSCGHYLNLICNSKPDTDTLKLVRTAEKKLGAKIKEPWACPSSYASWGIGGNNTSAETLDAKIAVKYPDVRLAEIVRIYANGQAHNAIQGLTNLKENEQEKHNPDVDKLSSSIGLAYGAYQDGVSSLETGDIRTAKDHWNLLFETDKIIMPDGFSSELANQARQLLAAQYLKLGEQMFQQERWVEAYKDWDEGFKIVNTDKLQQGFIRLEHEAEKIVNDPHSCTDLKNALSMTRDNSFSHKKALDIGKQQGCKGF
jgi:pSer/pThr/pTyr-binding forkhead associated (FHA) protein/tetratricopeptide (TPR) repeat protein